MYAASIASNAFSFDYEPETLHVPGKMPPVNFTPRERTYLRNICNMLEGMEHSILNRLCAGKCHPDETAAMFTLYQAESASSKAILGEKEAAALIRKAVSLRLPTVPLRLTPSNDMQSEVEIDAQDCSLPPTTFPKFPHLPFELRLRIWEMSLPAPGPRVIEVYANHISHQDTVSTATQWERLQLRGACKESKKVVEKAYQVVPNPIQNESHFSASKIVVDYDNDVFYDGGSDSGSHVSKRFTAAQRSAIHTIALPLYHGPDATRIPPCMRLQDPTWFDSLPLLRKIIWVDREVEMRDEGTEILWTEAAEKSAYSRYERRKTLLMDAWRWFVAGKDKTGSLRRIEHCFMEVKRPKPRQLLSREFRELLAREPGPMKS